MSEETPNFNIDPEGGMTPPDRFTYKGRQVEIVPPDTRRLIGNYWQIKIDGILQRDLLFSSLGVEASGRKNCSTKNKARINLALNHRPRHRKSDACRLLIAFCRYLHRSTCH
jgi:hypothetical protein